MSAPAFKRLRAGKWGGVDVVEFKPAPAHSVLAGQLLPRFLGNFPDEAAAMAAHPDADGYVNRWSMPVVTVSHLPGEDDPVPGGMWPDDIGEAR